MPLSLVFFSFDQSFGHWKANSTLQLAMGVMEPVGAESFLIPSLQIITDIPTDAFGGIVEFFCADLPAILFDLEGDSGNFGN